MKILKIFGIVVGIHFFALILIFANPGCSSTTKPAVAETKPDAGQSPVIPAPSRDSAPVAADDSEPKSSAITFNPDTPAAPPPPAAGDGGVRFTPTRPGTPVASALLAQPVKDVTPASTYTVKSGDNLWTIARRNNITLAQLTAANQLSPNATLRPGQKLIIPQRAVSVIGVNGGEASPVRPATTPAAPDAVKHVVKSGETLGGIARRYGVRQGDLAVANNIADPARIRPGMELVIPGWKAPGSKSAAPAAEIPAAPPAEESPVTPVPAAPPPVPVIQIDDAPAPRQP